MQYGYVELKFIIQWAKRVPGQWPPCHTLFPLSVFGTSLIPWGKCGSPYLGRAAAAARAVLSDPSNVCNIVLFPNNDMAASMGYFSCALMCWCVWLHTGVVWMPWESQCSKADCGKKPLPLKQTRVSIAPGFLVQRSTSWATSPPVHFVICSLPHCCFVTLFDVCIFLCSAARNGSLVHKLYRNGTWQCSG